MAVIATIRHDAKLQSASLLQSLPDASRLAAVNADDDSPVFGCRGVCKSPQSFPNCRDLFFERNPPPSGARLLLDLIDEHDADRFV
jgi:hypothetical protein